MNSEPLTWPAAKVPSPGDSHATAVARLPSAPPATLKCRQAVRRWSPRAAVTCPVSDVASTAATVWKVVYTAAVPCSLDCIKLQTEWVAPHRRHLPRQRRCQRMAAVWKVTRIWVALRLCSAVEIEPQGQVSQP